MARATKNAAKIESAQVNYIRQDLQMLLLRYTLIEDCIGGEDVIKTKDVTYLPKPNIFANSDTRYTGYLERAVFYGVAERTLDGMVGEVFAIDPDFEVPTALDAMMLDVTGGGQSVTQLAKQSVRHVLAFGRGGLFIDYPRVEKAATKKQLASGEIRPTIIFYESKDVINWRTFKRGSRTLLSLVVLRETVNAEVGQFGEQIEIQYRVLRLENDVYKQDLWRDNSGGNSSYSLDLDKSVEPLGFDGKPINEIPFTFIGAKDNDAHIDSPPLYSLCALNMAHYRNSADYEDSVFMVGQPTPWFAGLTEEWMRKVYPDGKIGLGSTGSIALPENGSAGLLQAAPNILVGEAMDKKERQMVALGARLVEQKTVQRTATEATLDTASQNSVLSTVAKNTSAAIKWSLEWAAWFVTGKETRLQDGKETGIEFAINDEFDLAQATPDEARAAVELWQKQALSFSEMRGTLRQSGMATLEDDKAKEEIASDLSLLPQLGEDTANGGGQDTVGAGA